MPKIATELSFPAVKALAKKPGVHAVGGVTGLYLQVTASSATPPGPPVASWVLRRTLKKTGERIKLGLGSYAEVSLAAAREEARRHAERIALGGDPLAERKEERSRAVAAKQAALTFEEAAPLCIKALEAGWSNIKHGKQWLATLQQYAYPVLGQMLVEDIQMQHVLRVLEPIWTTVPETADRVRGRIEKVIAWADARARRERQNPARWKNNLDTQLARTANVKKVRKHPALPVDDVAPFMVELRAMSGNGARALEFAILCASRSGEARGARWDEFSDLDGKAPMWVISAERMKMDREHRVPLSADAVRLLKAMPRLAEGEAGADLVFPSLTGKKLSDMTLNACFKRLNEKHEKARWVDPKQGGAEATAHGTARSTFTDWRAERTSFPSEMNEMALAHKVANAVEAAYRRGDMVEKRRKMMDAWAAFCATPRPAANVVPMSRRARGKM